MTGKTARGAAPASRSARPTKPTPRRSSKQRAKPARPVAKPKAGKGAKETKPAVRSGRQTPPVARASVKNTKNEQRVTTKTIEPKPAPTSRPHAPKPAGGNGEKPLRSSPPPRPGEPSVTTVERPPVAAVPEPIPPPVEAAPAAAATVTAEHSERVALPLRPVPRPAGREEVFAEGDHVVYPTHGVGKVERIAIEEIAGHRLELIHITFEENRMTLRVPVAKARSAGLRKLATRKMFDEALSVLRGRARIKRTMWSRRAQEYEAKINSGDPLAIAEVVRDLHRNAGQPDQSFSERQIYEAAMDRLSAELAALEKIDKVAAAAKLTDFLKTV